ncbi:MAG TPA: sigma-70 family RNA polymerase sigma factor [Terriglobales bacterium]|nr:sigma-70 family RNA polymerase sigma factor [Terriglobales bacterium]
MTDYFSCEEFRNILTTCAMTDPAQSVTATGKVTRSRTLRELLSRLYEHSGAARFGMSPEVFEALLHEIALKFLGNGAQEDHLRQLWESLRAEELVLARACAAGNERAWEAFMARYREKLYGAAAAIAKNQTAARELADSLYADLFGTSVREGGRVSKLASYTGRGSLEGWLRTVLAQEFVNHYRSGKRLVSMEEQVEQGAQFVAAAPPSAVTPDPRLVSAIDECLGALSPEDRFLLSAYYLDGHTLAEIGRTVRVHESTVSRKLEKLVANLRSAILKRLMRSGMDRRQAIEALETDVRDLGVGVRERLAQDLPSAPFLSEGRDRN